MNKEKTTHDSAVINFVDPNFEVAVREAMDKPYGPITKTDVEGITAMDISWKFISHMPEIKYFTHLESIDCGWNKLTSLDFSGNPLLRTIVCSRNPLDVLDVSRNPYLEVLKCFDCDLTQLDVSNNPILTELDCGNSGRYGSSGGIDDQECIRRLRDRSLAALDVSKNPVLKKLYCSHLNLTELNLSSNPELESLWCSGNKITKLDLSLNPKLICFRSPHSALTELLLTGCMQLADLDFHYSHVKKLDINGCVALKSLDCRNNGITELDVRDCPELNGLYCDDNQLTQLDISNNLALDCFTCANNNLTELKINEATLWEEFSCHNNPLPEFNVKTLTTFQVYCKKSRKSQFFACQIFLKDNTLVLLKNDLTGLEGVENDQVLYFLGVYGVCNEARCCLVHMATDQKPYRGRTITIKYTGTFYLFFKNLLSALVDKGVDKRIISSLKRQLYEYYDKDEDLRADEKRYRIFKERW